MIENVITNVTSHAINKVGLIEIPKNHSEKLLYLLPKITRPIIRNIPFSIQSRMLIPALHSVFKEAIEEGDFEFLQGKWLSIEINDLDLCWWLSFELNRLILKAPENNSKADVTFSASGDDLLLIAGRKQDPDTLFFQRRLKITGDTELGLEVKNLIDALDIEQLPSNVHKVVEIFSHWINQTKTT